jgi:hypothetical protein
MRSVYPRVISLILSHMFLGFPLSFFGLIYCDSNVNMVFSVRVPNKTGVTIALTIYLFIYLFYFYYIFHILFICESLTVFNILIAKA